MPFGTTLPLSHDSSALAPRRDSASGPQGGPSSPIRLDRLPDEVLLHIANDLDATSILALGESCTSVYVALWRDHVRPLQLEGRLRWTTTITDLHAVLSNLGQCCRDGRQRLLELGWVQSRHLHPCLQARAQRVLRAMTPPPSDDERLHQRLDAFLAVRSVTDDTQMPALLSLLEEIEHGDAASRGPLLVHWLAVAGGAGVMCRALDAWRATMSRLPRADAIALLVALLDASHGLEDPVRWNGTMQLAIDNAQTGADAQRWDQPWRADLLCAAARALAGPEIMAAPTAGGMAGMPVALWQQLWGLLPRLAEPARVRLSVALAGSLATIDKLHLANPPRWSALIAHAGTLHGASATADVLEAIAGHIEDHGVKQQRPLVHALVAAAWPLPEPDRARVLVQVLFHTPEREVALLSSLWDRLYDISATAGSAVQSMILWALGRLVDATARGNGTRDERATRWLAVLERSKGLPEQEHRLHAMLGLISMNPLSSAGAAVDPDICLLQAGARLADSDRANLLAILLAMGGRCATPASWRLAVKTAIGLPPALRFQAFAGLAHRLQAFDVHFGRWAHDDTAQLSGPDIAWVSDWPTSPNEARRLLSALLRLLTPGERARLLLALATTSSSLTSEGVLWLLDEGRALPRTGRHDVALVHAAAAWLARCPESEGHAVMAGLWQDVVALAAGYRAAALLHINDFVRRHGCAPSLRQPLAAELARLSPHDREAEPAPSAHGSGPYKRKAGAALQPPH